MCVYLLQDIGHHIPHLWLSHADRLHDLLRVRVPGRKDPIAGAQRGSLLDATLAKEYWLYAAGDQLQGGQI